MRKGDLIIFIAGLAVVLAISLAAQPSGILLPGLFAPDNTETTETDSSDPLFLKEFALKEPETKTPSPAIPIKTLQLVESPFGYPRVYMPGSSASRYGTYRVLGEDHARGFPLFGAIPYTSGYYDSVITEEWVPFARLEQSRGGVSTYFFIPDTPIWRIQAEVTADRHPGTALFLYVVCDAETGAILDRMEITGAGSGRSIVHTSGKEMYFITSAQNLDRYHIQIEVPLEYL